MTIPDYYWYVVNIGDVENIGESEARQIMMVEDGYRNSADELAS